MNSLKYSENNCKKGKVSTLIILILRSLLQFSSRPSWLRHFSRHPAPERNPQGGRRDYCGYCRMPVLSYQHYERHGSGLPSQLTKLCKFCDLNIFKDKMKVHALVHKDQHFRLILVDPKSVLLISFYHRCLLGNCARSPKYFMYKNVLMTHQGNLQSCCVGFYSGLCRERARGPTVAEHRELQVPHGSRKVRSQTEDFSF